jgi:hypothetical protein
MKLSSLQRPRRVTLALVEDGSVVRVPDAADPPAESDPFWVEYLPNNITADMEDELDDVIGRLNADKGQLRALAELFAVIVSDWDVIGDDGEPVPCDVDHLVKVPSAFLSAVSVAIFQDQQPPPEASRPSG